VRSLTSDHLRGAFEELDPYIASDVLLGFGDERVKRIPQRAEPQAVVNHLRPLLRDEVLETRDLLRKGDVLERLMGLEDPTPTRDMLGGARQMRDQILQRVHSHVSARLATFTRSSLSFSTPVSASEMSMSVFSIVKTRSDSSTQSANASRD